MSWRDDYYWKAKGRYESCEDEREFEELLKRDWEEFERAEKTMSAAFIN